MKKRIFVAAAVLAAFMALGQAALFAQTRLEPYLEIELKRLEETYRLMDTYAQTIWPGWDNYMEIEFKVQYPNLVQLLVGPRDKVPEGYELVPDRTVRGKKVYLNRKDELPIKVQPPLLGGGKGGLTIRIFMGQLEIDRTEADKAVTKAIAEKNFTFTPPGSSDNEIILYVHEFFHGYQRRAMMNRAEAMEKARKAGNLPAGSAVKKEEPRKRPAEDRDREGEGFQANTGYSTHSSIEGRALFNAYMEKDKAKALECLKDYMVAREIKQTKFMTPDAAAEESEEALSEGTAVYANTKMLMLIKNKKYKSAMTQKDDPFFYGFRFADGKIAEDTRNAMERDKDDTLSTLKCYSYGVYQCLVLDRFFPGWNKGLYEKGLNLDQVTAAKLNLSDQEKTMIAERLRAKYDYDNLYARHAAVIADRDEIMNIVKSRQGRTYIIDMQKTRDFVYAIGRGRFINVSVSGYFVNGIQDLKLGDIELTTWNTPLHKPFLYTLEWTDTGVKPDEKNYTFYYEKKDGDVYKNIVFTTPGFTLKAPEVQIREIKEKNQFRIDVLSKVAR